MASVTSPQPGRSSGGAAPPTAAAGRTAASHCHQRIITPAGRCCLHPEQHRSAKTGPGRSAPPQRNASVMGMKKNAAIAVDACAPASPPRSNGRRATFAAMPLPVPHGAHRQPRRDHQRATPPRRQRPHASSPAGQDRHERIDQRVVEPGPVMGSRDARGRVHRNPASASTISELRKCRKSIPAPHLVHAGMKQSATSLKPHSPAGCSATPTAAACDRFCPALPRLPIWSRSTKPPSVSIRISRGVQRRNSHPLRQLQVPRGRKRAILPFVA